MKMNNIAMLYVAICIDRQASNIDISHIEASEIMQIQIQHFSYSTEKVIQHLWGLMGKIFSPKHYKMAS